MAHVTQIPVRFSELDPYSHLNHAAYAVYFEAARIDALRETDLGLVALTESGFQFVVTQLVIDYKSPANAEDTVSVETVISQVRRATTVWTQTMTRDGDLLARATVTACVTNVAGRPVRPPEFVMDRIQPLVGEPSLH